jgi:hypothetical protein
VTRRRRGHAFNAWLVIQLRGRVCERWRSFAQFYRDVGPRPTWRHLLLRTDPSLSFSPTNARWQIERPRYRRRRPTARLR